MKGISILARAAAVVAAALAAWAVVIITALLIIQNAHAEQACTLSTDPASVQTKAESCTGVNCGDTIPTGCEQPHEAATTVTRASTLTDPVGALAATLSALTTTKGSEKSDAK